MHSKCMMPRIKMKRTDLNIERSVRGRDDCDDAVQPLRSFCAILTLHSLPVPLLKGRRSHHAANSLDAP